MKKFLLPLFIILQFISAAQNVSVGAGYSSRAKFEVNGAAGGTAAIFGGESSGVSLQRDWPGIGFNQYYNGSSRYISNGYAGVQFVDPANGYMAFDLFGSGTANNVCAPGTRPLVFYANGTVASGPNYYNANLVSSKIAGAEAAINLYGSTHLSTFNYGAAENTYIRAGKNNGTVFINDIPGSKVVLSGYVGINTPNPIAPLEIRQSNNQALILVHGSDFSTCHFYINPSTYNFTLQLNGFDKGYFKTTDGSYHTISDRRLKAAIAPLYNVLDKVAQLQPVEYEMKRNNPGHERSIGFIAQEVKEIFPQLVTVINDSSHNEEGLPDFHAINYSGFGVVAIKAIQEQQVEIEAQQITINSLQGKLDKVEAMLREKQKSRAGILVKK